MSIDLVSPYCFFPDSVSLILVLQSEREMFFKYVEYTAKATGNPSCLCEIEDMDRISQLPESIVNHILSFLKASPVDLVRMSVLSKSWFHLTASFPILDFNIRDFKSPESFFKYVEYTSFRFYHQNLIAHTFKLTATIRKPAKLDVVNRCLERVINKGVQVLEINIANFRLPNALLSVSVLESLTIHHCELPTSLMLDDAKFKSLIKLKLVTVPIDDEVIRHLTTSCPRLQVFEIKACEGFKRFCVYGHQHLQIVWILCVTPVERIDIEAPNLSTLLIMDLLGKGAAQMNLASCTKLTTVFYMCSSNLNGYTDFLSNFPFIENLFFVTTSKCNNLKLSSHSLRTLVLHSNFDLEDIEFNTPNLVLLISTCKFRMFWPLVMDKAWPMVRHSTPLQSCMQCYFDGCTDALWFQKLRQFLDKKNGFKVLSLCIHAKYSQKFIELAKLEVIDLSSYELEHVELQESLAHIAFVDAVLCCFRPRSLTLRSSFHLTDFEEHSDVVKFTYGKLLEQEDQSHTNIQIVSHSSSEAQKHLGHLNSLSPMLPWTRKEKTVSFIKEQS